MNKNRRPDASSSFLGWQAESEQWISAVETSLCIKGCISDITAKIS